jgi:hypothetical protein
MSEPVLLDEIPEIESLMTIAGEPTRVKHDTHRGIKSYESIFHISPEELEGKIVVDLGSARDQKFAAEIAKSAEYNPATVISIDPLAEPSVDSDPSLVLANADAMPFNSSVDLILACNSVPEYLRSAEDIKKVFQEIIESLKIGGKAKIFPLAFSESKSDFDPETQKLSAPTLIYMPDDDGVFRKIFGELKEQYKIDIVLDIVWCPDPEDPDEKKAYFRVTITREG